MPIIKINNQTLNYWQNVSIKSGYVFLTQPDISDFVVFVEFEA